jgi:aspartyl-tRNA(Asn)/glutamyl-tRNA(Gln) amidotransferase subunit C
MSIGLGDVHRIAHLARLAVSDEDALQLTRDLSRILELVEQMNVLDTAAVQSMAHPLDMVQRLRPDEVTEANQRDLFQAIAPQTDGGLYLVPKVIE